jgi:hypothetical protein
MKPRTKAILGVVLFFAIAIGFGVRAGREEKKEQRSCIQDRGGKVVAVHGVNAPGGWICQEP